MKNTTMFPREEHADVLFQKILNDPWACEKLQETFCNSLALNDDTALIPLLHPHLPMSCLMHTTTGICLHF